ncbi:MAG: hypothetical protein WD066_15170 [Planctomycetaceae bacterium]
MSEHRIEIGDRRARLTSDAARILAIAIVACVAWTAFAQEIEAPLVRSVPEIVTLDEATLKRWTALELPLRIEGRYSAFTPGLVRMKGWDVPIVPQGVAELVRPAGRRLNVEFTGHFALRDGKRVFMAESSRGLPDDRETFVVRRGKIDHSVAAEWYALGRWAIDRGRFYGDDELIARGGSALQSGFALERAKVSPNDAAGRWRLAARAVELGLPAELRDELVHEAWLAERDAVRRADGDELAKLADRIARELPGAGKPLSNPQPELRDAYRENRRGTYASDADPARRATLHRLLYAELMLTSLQRQVAADGANAYRIADRIDAMVPEHHEAAEELREQRIAAELKRLESLDQTEMLALARRIRLRNQPERARQTIADWLAFAETRARREGPPGLVRVADRYRTLLEDDERQMALLVEAHRASGFAEDIGLRLEELGYRLRAGEWTRDAAAAPPRRAATIDAAILEGRVLPGMTPEQVRLAWRAPDAVARLATAGEVTEVWSFTEPGRSTTAVHFRRGAHQRPESARAVLVQPIE